MNLKVDLLAPVASALFMGLGQLVFLRQYVKGVFFAVMEILTLINLSRLIKGVVGFITLGEPKSQLPVVQRDHSIFMMIDGIVTIVILLFIILLYLYNIYDARSNGIMLLKTGKVQSTREYLKELADKAFSYIVLSPVVVMIIFFVLVPLLFSALLAFTNYSAPYHIPPANTVDWVGLQTFKEIVEMKLWSKAFISICAWTVVWGVVSTLTVYCGGMFMAIALLDKKIKLGKFFRTIFVMPWAIPSMVSLLVWQNLLNGKFGPINRALQQLGIINDYIPWLSDPMIAKVTLICVNLWIGFPYFMMLITGVMTSISPELYEAAAIDGASPRQRFRRITLPLTLYQTMPMLIMSLSYSMNNFGAVYFLTGGGPTISISTQSGAGATDIILSWIYKLTYDLRVYNKAAAISIVVFLAMAPFAIYNFSRTKAFKDGEL